VDDVVIGAPYIITDDLIKSLAIEKVIHVVTAEDPVKPDFKDLD
jgi:ethanolamine-phosphate cytidylyltransferase